MGQINILGIAGSLRAKSLNRAALNASKHFLPDGCSLNIFDLEGVPNYNEDLEMNPPGKVVELRKAINEAHAILVVTPEYNYSISGVLKNAIDWASRPYGSSVWNRKAAAIMGASAGMLGTARAQYQLRQMFVALNVSVVNQPEVMISNANQKFDADGNLTDDATKKHIRRLLETLVEYAKRD